MTRPPDLKVISFAGRALANDAQFCVSSSSRSFTSQEFQLSLPLDDRMAKQIVIVAMEHIHGIRLCGIIRDLMPKVAVDVRHLIRFDLPGTSRSEIFSQFAMLHTLYVKASLPWHTLTPRDFMLETIPLSQRLSHEVVERDDTPVLLLASRKVEVRYLTTFLSRALSAQARSPWKIVEAI